jgi:cell surface protein SprA
MARKTNSTFKRKYKSSATDGIPIGAYNVPQGSVVVTAGGRV